MYLEKYQTKFCYFQIYKKHFLKFKVYRKPNERTKDLRFIQKPTQKLQFISTFKMIPSYSQLTQNLTKTVFNQAIPLKQSKPLFINAFLLLPPPLLIFPFFINFSSIFLIQILFSFLKSLFLCLILIIHPQLLFLLFVVNPQLIPCDPQSFSEIPIKPKSLLIALLVTTLILNPVISNCASNQYLDTNSVCQNCNSPCATCSGPSFTQCTGTTCHAAHTMDGTTCKLNCTTNTYWESSNNTCGACDSACKTCTGPSFTQCSGTTCTASHTMTGTTCKLNCASNQYWISSNNTCQQCNVACARCTGPANNQCSACNGGFTLSGTTCNRSCASNQYLQTSDNTCQACVSPCVSCTGPASNQCTGTTCAANHTMNGTTCQINCASNQYWRSSDNTCQLCNANCLTCNEATSSDCLSCPSTHFFTVGVSPKGTCTACNAACVSCTGAAFNQCSGSTCAANHTLSGTTCQLNCASNQYYEASNNTCPACNAACVTCTGPSFTQCSGTSCAANHTLSGTTCQLNCASNQFWQSSDNTCQACNSTCLTCNGLNTSDCLTCPSTHFFTVGVSPKGTCSSCNAACVTCTGAAFTQCSGTTCAANHTMNGTTCRLNCASNQFWRSSDNTCQPCSSTCLTCSGPTTNDCLTCSTTQYHTMVSSPAGTCSACVNPCVSCTGPAPTQCAGTTCVVGFTMTGTTCHSNCPQANQWYRTSDASCQPCDSSCTTCYLGATANDCTSCPATQYVAVVTSPRGACTACVAPCVNCTGASFSQCSGTTCSSSLYTMTGTTCKLNCTSSQWWNSADNTCQACNASCVTCQSGATTSNCLTCSPGQYLSVVNSPEGQCLPCDSSCGGTCSGPGHQNCSAVACSAGFFKVGNECKRVCPDGQYQRNTDNTCQMCHSSCRTCINGNTAANCLSCSLDDNYSPSVASNQERTCLQCDRSCGRKCFGPTFKECNADAPCTQGYAILATECQKICPKGQFRVKKDNTCQDCGKAHSDCFGAHYTESRVCREGYSLENVTECRLICKADEFWGQINNICLKCPEGCAECDETDSSKCLKCQEQHKLIKGQCTKICTAEEYYDKEKKDCFKCDKSCTGCTGESKFDCVKCKDKYLLQLDKSCLVDCEPGTYADLGINECVRCHEDCKTCTGPLKTECKSCYEDNKLYTPKLLQNRCVNCSVDYESFPEDCKNTLELQVNFLKVSQLDRVNSIHRIRIIPSNKKEHIDSLKTTIQEKDWLDKYLGLEVKTREKTQQQLDDEAQKAGVTTNSTSTNSTNSTNRMMQALTYDIKTKYNDTNGIVDVIIELNNKKEELSDLFIKVKDPVLLQKQIAELMMAKKDYQLKQAAFIPSESSKASAAALQENKATATSVTSAINGAAGASAGASIIGGVFLSTVVGTLLGVLFKFFQVMDNIGNLQLVNVEYGPFMNEVFEIIDSIQLAPDLNPDFWMKNHSYKPAVFRKTLAVATENFEDGHIIQTVPFGWFFYMFVFTFFRILNAIRLRLHSKFRNINKTKRLSREHILDQENYKNWRLAAKKRLSKFDSFMSFFYEVKSFGFNLFVLDLSLGSYYELAATDIAQSFKYSAKEFGLIISPLISLLIISFLFYDFWELFIASGKAQLSKQAKDFLAIGSMLKKREKFEKEYEIDNLPSDMNLESDKDQELKSNKGNQDNNEDKQARKVTFAGDNDFYKNEAIETPLKNDLNNNVFVQQHLEKESTLYESQNNQAQSQSQAKPNANNQELLDIKEEKSQFSNFQKQKSEEVDSDDYQEEGQGNSLGDEVSHDQPQKNQNQKVLQYIPKVNDGDDAPEPPRNDMRVNFDKLQINLKKDEEKLDMLMKNKSQLKKKDKKSKPYQSAKIINQQLSVQESVKKGDKNLQNNQTKFQQQYSKVQSENVNEIADTPNNGLDVKGIDLLISTKDVQNENIQQAQQNNQQSDIFETLQQQGNEQQNNQENENQSKSLINKKYPEFKKFVKENKLTEMEIILKRPDVIENKLQKSVLSGIHCLNLSHKMIRVYNPMFLARYVAFGIVLIGLQLIQRAQIIMIFGMQLIYFAYYARLVIKHRFFEDRYSYWAFFIQEGAMTFFLLMTTGLVNLQWSGVYIGPDLLFQIELMQVIAIGLAFFVEVMGLFIAIFGLVSRMFNSCSKKCCKKDIKQNKSTSKNEEDRDAQYTEGQELMTPKNLDKQSSQNYGKDLGDAQEDGQDMIVEDVQDMIEDDVQEEGMQDEIVIGQGNQEAQGQDQENI